MHILFSFNCIYEDGTQCSFKLDRAPNVLENLQDQMFYKPKNFFQNQIRGFVQPKRKNKNQKWLSSFQNQELENGIPYKVGRDQG